MSELPLLNARSVNLECIHSRRHCGVRGDRFLCLKLRRSNKKMTRRELHVGETSSLLFDKEALFLPSTPLQLVKSDLISWSGFNVSKQERPSRHIVTTPEQVPKEHRAYCKPHHRQPRFWEHLCASEMNKVHTLKPDLPHSHYAASIPYCFLI